MSHPSRPTLTVFRRTACELCDDAEQLLQAVLEERVVRGDVIPQVRRVVIDGDPDLESRFGGTVPVFDLDGTELALVTSRRQVSTFLDRLMPRVV
jgi:Glutaredoxin-like domain (DUF836)